MTPAARYRWWTFAAGIERFNTERLRGVFAWAKLGPLSICAYPPMYMKWIGIVLEVHLLNAVCVGITLGA